jgi:hypothetical protein
MIIRGETDETLQFTARRLVVRMDGTGCHTVR